MKKQSSLSKAEMKKVIGGGASGPQACLYVCEGVYSIAVSNCMVIDIKLPVCPADANSYCWCDGTGGPR